MNTICFFNSIEFWGGGEKLLFENAVEFHKKNYEVVLAAKAKSPLWEKATQANMETFPVTVGNLSFLNIFKIVRLVLFFRKRKVDTVIFTTSHDLKLGSIAAKIAGVSNIVYLRGLAVPIKASLVNRFIFKKALTHIISNSDETKRNILKHLGKHIDKNKVHVIYHGIEAEEYVNADKTIFREIKHKAHGVILGSAGRLTKQKGQEHLIEVAKILKSRNIDFTLFIAGTGDLYESLQNKINDNNLQHNVILLGFVDDMKAFMNSIDVFLLSSVWEGFGFVLVEAMICAKPVVAFDITSNPEIVEHGKTGFLVDYPNVNAFADKVEELIGNNELRSEMGNQGMERVRKYFILKDKVTEIEQLLKHG